MDKVLYQDGDNVKRLLGTITKEDEHFIYLTMPISGEFRIGKKHIISIRQEKQDETSKHDKNP